MAFLVVAVFAEFSKRLPRSVAAVPAAAAAMLVFALMYRLPEIAF